MVDNKTLEILWKGLKFNLIASLSKCFAAEMGGAPDAKTIHSNQKETVQVVLWNKTCDVQII